MIFLIIFQQKYAVNLPFLFSILSKNYRILSYLEIFYLFVKILFIFEYVKTNGIFVTKCMFYNYNSLYFIII